MATRTYSGNAPAVAQVSSATVGGTWANGDTIEMELNDKSVTVTVGDDVATTDVALMMAEAWNSATLTSSTASYSPDGGGDLYLEMKELTASASSSSFVLTADTAGKPFTAPTMTVTSASGTVGSFSTTTANSGPNVWDLADNWEEGAVPVNSDDVEIPKGVPPIYYGLDQNAVTLSSLKLGDSVNIGLPNRVVTGSLSYDQYLERYLKISATTVDISGAGSPSQLVRLDLGSNQSTINITGTGSPVESGGYAVEIVNSHASSVLSITKGSVVVADESGLTSQFATINCGYQNNQNGDVTMKLGSGATLATVNQSGGHLTINSATTLVEHTGGTLLIEDGAHTAINSSAGTLDYRSDGTITTLTASGDTRCRFDQDLRSRTVTNCSVYSGANIYDQHKTVTWTNGIDLQRCSLQDVALLIGSHFTVSTSSI